MIPGRFECVKDCSDCCVERAYYPSKKFGKIGVLILPEERKKIERLASTCGIDAVVLPRIGTSDARSDEPDRILAYQLMGRDVDGNTCPFLDISGDMRSPHGGLACKIYDQRPMACRAYPVIGQDPPELDPKCRFCQDCGGADSNIDSELESLARISDSMQTDASKIWRYATGVGRPDDSEEIELGWREES